MFCACQNIQFFFLQRSEWLEQCIYLNLSLLQWKYLKNGDHYLIKCLYHEVLNDFPRLLSRLFKGKFTTLCKSTLSLQLETLPLYTSYNTDVLIQTIASSGKGKIP